MIFFFLNYCVFTDTILWHNMQYFKYFFVLLEPRGQADINIQKQMAREDRLLMEFMAADENAFCASQVVTC